MNVGILLVDLPFIMLRLRNSISACPSASQVAPASVLVGDHAPLGDLDSSPPYELVCKLDRFTIARELPGVSDSSLLITFVLKFSWPLIVTFSVSP